MIGNLLLGIERPQTIDQAGVDEYAICSARPYS